MLHLYKQYKGTLLKLISYFDAGELSRGLEWTEEEKKDFLKDNATPIIDYITSIDSEKNKDWKISEEDLNMFFGTKNLNAINKLLDTLWLDKIYQFSWEHDISAIAEKIKDYTSSKKEVKAQAKEDKKILKTDIETKFKEKDTAQFYDKGIKWTFWDLLTLEDSRDNVNIRSFSKMLRRMSATELDNLYTSLINTSRENNSKTDDSWKTYFYYTPFNINELVTIVKEAWYKSNWLLWWEEMLSLIGLIESYNITQKRIPALKSEDKIRMLFDFDKDWVLETDKNFQVWELQINFHTFESLTSDWSAILIDNLALWTIWKFETQMGENFLKSREKFHRALWSAIERWIKPAELLVKDWGKKATEKMYEWVTKTSEKQEKIKDDIDIFVEKKLSRLDGKYKKHIKSELKIKSIWVLLWPDTKGIWISMWIEELTNGFLSCVSIWISDSWVPWIAFSAPLFKEFLWEYGITLTASLANFFIPAISASKSFTPDADFDGKELFTDEIDSKLWATVYASLFAGWYVVWWALQRVDEETSLWVEQMTEGMKDLLSWVKKDLKEGKSFGASSLKERTEKDSKDWILDKEIYDHMKTIFDNYAKGKITTEWWVSIENAFLDDMMAWYLSHYKTKLYQNAEWVKLTNIWGWVALLAWFYPLPYLTIGWEHISTEWNKVIHSMDRERDISWEWKSISLEKLGWEVISENWLSLISLPILDRNYQLSDSTWKAQLQRFEDKILLWWDLKLSDITINEFSTATGVTYTIVVWGWKKDEKWLYLPTEENKIENWLNTLAKKEINTFDIDAFNNTLDIRSNINTVIGYDALKHPKTVWMMELQRMVFDYKKWWKTTIDNAWTQLTEVVLNKKWFLEYTNNKWTEKQAKELIEQIKSIESDEEKNLILQAMVMSFMKKKWLQIQETGIVNIDKTIKKYDKNWVSNWKSRAEFFDKIFKKEGLLIWDFSGNLNISRQKWYTENWSAQNYAIKTINDWSIAFTWVQSAKGKKLKSQTQIMPYTWAYNIASVEWWQDFVPIEWKSPELVNKIPNKTLKVMKTQLEELGFTLTSIQSVKDFINNWGTIDGQIKVEYDLAYCKSWECLNDTIVLRNLRLETPEWTQKLWVSSSWEVYKMKPEIINLGIVITWKLKEKEKDKEEVTEEPEKTEEPENTTKPPTTKPPTTSPPTTRPPTTSPPTTRPPTPTPTWTSEPTDLPTDPPNPTDPIDE